MSNLIEKIKSKLEEYNITIFDHYKLEHNDYIFIVEDMFILVHKNTQDISVAFQVSTKPEIAANNTLILLEVKQIKNISVMESFAFNSEQQIVYGEKAYKLLDDSIKKSIICDLETDQAYTAILMKSKGYEC